MKHDEILIMLTKAAEAQQAGTIDLAEQLAGTALSELEVISMYYMQDNEREIEGKQWSEGSIARLKARAVYMLGSIFQLRGMYSQSLENYAVTLKLHEVTGDKDGIAKVLTSIGSVYWYISEYDKALEYFQKAMVVYEEMGNVAGVASILGNCGVVYRNLSEYSKALEYFHKALAINTELDRKSGIASNLSNCGLIYSCLSDYTQALEHYQKALTMFEELGSKDGMASNLGNIGIVYMNLSDNSKALEYYQKALEIFQQLGSKDGIARNLGNIGSAYSALSEYSRALEYAQKALSIYEEIGSKSGIAINLSCIGNIYHQLSDNAKAMEYYQRTLAIYEEIGSKDGIATCLNGIGNVYQHLSEYGKSLEYFRKALIINEEIGDKNGIAMNLGNCGLVHWNQLKYSEALEYYKNALSLYTESGNKNGVATILSNCATVYADSKEFEKALEYYRQSLCIYEEIDRKDGVSSTLGNIGATYVTLNYGGNYTAIAEEYLSKAITLCEEIGAKQNLYEFHKTLSELYKAEKRWEECHIHFERYHIVEKEVLSTDAQKQISHLEHRRKIEESERDHQVKLARFQEQEKILYNILPAQIAERMVAGEKTIADSHQHVSVFFSDIVDFTKLSQRVSAEELVRMLNGIFTQFDQLARKHGLEKIKTIGDAYMAVCGAPIPANDHAERTAHFALDVAELMNNYQIDSGDKVMIRIGLHSGSAVAGIIGENKFAYDMWGDAVNTASRMESHGEPGKIHVSEEFKHAVKTLHATSLQFIRRGEMDIKGKGKMNTYFLEKI